MISSNKVISKKIYELVLELEISSQVKIECGIEALSPKAWIDMECSNLSSQLEFSGLDSMEKNAEKIFL